MMILMPTRAHCLEELAEYLAEVAAVERPEDGLAQTAEDAPTSHR